ncbi:MAG: DUF2092 domain-containing protein [Methylococcaceae bacterium]|jgi:hypothetical protein|nr:DUF2092 domain-containing protein [Methylococcaceae bacterium]MDZ4156179.1 DUF2092 domain-containing protein [Methylococcales bacterium]MDP2393757.1 DUF2092 domain-containing protein [Methylococcaceae bacterium]MDP3019783.1 DUF2092 domain-containing protein [Methylococcaceae bacterium]MDP3389612.1 DUF2092 domain-containing protein [Methylococcaceae bacterium]
MIKTLQKGTRNALCVAILAALAGCAEHQTVTQSDTLASAAAAVPQAAVQEPTDAKDLLLRMANYLAKAQKFTVAMTDNYDTFQASGQKIEFGEKRNITVSRPNGLRVELEESNGEKHVFLYDGKDMTVFSPSQNVYAQAAKAGGIDEAVVYLLKDLHMRLPLAALLLSRFPTEIESRTQALDYVEKTTIHGVPAHHLAGRTETVDYQVWIPEGTQPLPLRIVLTYKNADGQPQFSAQFSDWNLSPTVSDSKFVFVPPAGSRKIAFAAQVTSIAPAAIAAPTAIGGKP